MTLADALIAAAGTGRGFVFVDGQERESELRYTELLASAQRAAGALHAAGVRPGQRVAIVLPTGPLFMQTLFGCLMLGAVVAPLYPPVRLGRLDEYIHKTATMLDACDAVALVSDRRTSRILGRVVATRPTPYIAAESINSGAYYTGPGPGADDLALVQFSSGTTHQPKPVALSHRQILANVHAIVAQIPDDAERVGCCWLPLYHDMGLIGCVFTAVVGQGKLVLLQPEQFLAKPALWLRAISRHRATVSPAPNFAYALCSERIADDAMVGVDLSSWRLALNGAEPVAPASLRRFTQRFAAWGLPHTALTPVYGLAEAALAVTFSAVDAPHRTVTVDRSALARGTGVTAVTDATHTVELASVGTPLPGFGVSLRDPQRDEVVEGVVARVWVRGPSLMSGYLSHPDSPFDGEWLDTGDLGVMLDGELFITGRAKDTIVLRGQNHSPHDIEQAVDTVPGVRVGCAVAVGQFTVEGERLLVFVEARDPSDALAQACHRAIVSKTGLSASLVTLVAPGTVPRTSSGKLRRGETLRRYVDNTLSPPDQVHLWRMAGHLAASALAWARAPHRR